MIKENKTKIFIPKDLWYEILMFDQTFETFISILHVSKTNFLHFFEFNNLINLFKIKLKSIKNQTERIIFFFFRIKQLHELLVSFPVLVQRTLVRLFHASLKIGHLFQCFYLHLHPFNLRRLWSRPDMSIAS